MNKLIILIVVCFLLLISCEKKTEFTIVEQFVDSSADGTAAFAFVSVKTYNKIDMINFSRNFKCNYDEKLNKDSLPLVVIIHFFKLKDTIPLPQSIKDQIKESHPNLVEGESKLQCVNGAYIYRNVSSFIEHKLKEKDTIINTLVIIPKKGVSAKELMK